MSQVEVIVINSGMDDPINNEFSEGKSSENKDRIGKTISIMQATSNKVSGVKKSFLDGPEILSSQNDDRYDGNIDSKGSQGISIRSGFDTTSDYLPYMYIGESPYPKNKKERYMPKLGNNATSLGYYETTNKDYYRAFDDISDFDPLLYINASDYDSNKIYPNFSGSIYKDVFGETAVLEPFEIRSRIYGKSLIENNSHVSDARFFSGIRADLFGTGRNIVGKGSQSLNQFVNKSGVDTPSSFDDTINKDILYSNLKPRSSRQNDYQAKLTSFSDTVDYITGSSYSFMTEGQVDTLISGSRRDMSEIGTRYKSTTAGFTYESSPVGNFSFGTDSIAFGGMNRRI